VSCFRTVWGEGEACLVLLLHSREVESSAAFPSFPLFPFRLGGVFFFNGIFALGLMDRNDGGLDQMGTMVLYEHLLINDRIEERRVQTAIDEAGWDREGDEDGALLYEMCIF
jgi:hypothetical protein